MLSEIDLQRLNRLKKDIDLLGLRHPIATIARRTGCDKGNVSRVLSGKAACSDNFLEWFYLTFEADLKDIQSNSEANMANWQIP